MYFYDWVYYLEEEKSIVKAVIGNEATIAHISQDGGCLAIMWYG